MIVAYACGLNVYACVNFGDEILLGGGMYVATQIPGPTRMADPNRSPVYPDAFIYLIKTFYYVISL